ncbi:MAG: ribonuclease HII [Candidatus Micrarchaeota archaeon]
MVFIIIAGGDEAGRGAVLGPLVVSLVSINEGKVKKLSEIGVRDSKMLSRKKREFLFDDIYSLAEDVRTYAITPEEINNAMRSNISLNELEAIHFARLIDESEANPKKIFLDSPDVIPEKFGIRVSLISKKPLKVNGVRRKGKNGSGSAATAVAKIIAEHKADVKYPVVSAASIIAKVTRDRAIEELEESLGFDLGSGYPSDKTTLDMIRRNLDNERLLKHVRSEWKTLKLIRQLKIFEFLK